MAFDRERIAESFAQWWTWLWPGAALLIAAGFALFVVRPFGSSSPVRTSEDVAAAWNQGIGRLGILPVFPPTEDLFVGDVWAVVADSEETPLLGKSVRIGHINLRSELLLATEQPVFADTAELEKGAPFRKQDRQERVRGTEPDARISLALAAFPGISIDHSLRAGAAASAGGGWFAAGRNQMDHEQIRIKAAETYGISTISAIMKFDDWCTDEATGILCNDAMARRALAYAVNDRVLATKNGKFTTRLQLQLVTRVFLTREIEHARIVGSANGAKLESSANLAKAEVPAPSPVPSAETDSSKRVASALDNLARTLSAPDANIARISSMRSDGVEISMNEVFVRPIVFGYRAVTIALQPSEPGKDTVP